MLHENINYSHNSISYSIIDLIIILEIANLSREDVDVNMGHCLSSLGPILSTEYHQPVTNFFEICNCFYTNISSYIIK